MGTLIRVACPAACDLGAAVVVGSGPYADESHMCAAAIHAGAINVTAGGLVVAVVGPNATADLLPGSTAHGVVTAAATVLVHRTFTVRAYNRSNVQVETIVGAPDAPLSDAPCGMLDGQPPQLARLNVPAGIALRRGVAGPTDTELLVIADAGNHRIRVVTAVCSKAGLG